MLGWEGWYLQALILQALILRALVLRALGSQVPYRQV